MIKKSIPILAAMVLALALGLAARYHAGQTAETSDGARVPEAAAVPVKTTPLESRVFEQAIEIQGNVAAKRYANVPARLFGPLEAVFVEEGDRVEAGVTQLFQVDQENLQRTIQIAEQDVAVALCAERESAANAERVEADLAKAETDYQRFQRLAGRNAATRDAVEQQESRYKQVQALRKHAEAMVDLTREQRRQAEVALEIARRRHSDSLVVAPLSGTVTQRLAEPGEIADGGKTILRIEDLSLLEVSAFLPAEHFARVVPGETRMRVEVGAIDAGTHPVSYRSPTIHPKLRTFEVRCLLENPVDGVAPGAMARITVLLDRRESLGVPRDAVQSRGAQQVVFTIVNGAARRVPVELGLASEGWIAITGDGLASGLPVVTTGQDRLDDGMPVTVEEGGA
jgi:RND family efflux transporter MFP subunit